MDDDVDGDEEGADEERKREWLIRNLGARFERRGADALGIDGPAPPRDPRQRGLDALGIDGKPPVVDDTALQQRAAQALGQQADTLFSQLDQAPQAEVAERTALRQQRGVFQAAVAAAAPNLAALRATLNGFVHDVPLAITAMAAARAEHARLSAAEQQLKLPADTDAEADSAALARLAELRATLLGALAGAEPRGATLPTARDALAGWQSAAQALAEAVAERLARRRERLLRDAETVLRDLKALGNAAPALLAPALNAAKAVGEALPTDEPSAAAIAEAERRLGTLKDLAAAAAIRIQQLAQTAGALAERLGKAPMADTDLAADDIPAWVAASQRHREASGLLKTLVLGDEELAAFRAAVERAEEARATATEVLQQLRARAVVLGKRLAEAKPPEEALADTRDHLDAQRKLATKALQARLSSTALDDAEREVKALEDACSDAVTEAAELGGNAGLQVLLGAFGDPAGLDKAFGDRKALRGLSAAMSPAALVKLAQDLAGGDAVKGAAQLTKLAAVFAPKDLPAIAKSAGAANLVALAARPGGAAQAKTLVDELSPGLIGQLMKKPADADRLDKLLVAFGGDASALRLLAKEGGLEARPEALAAVLEGGCADDPARFAAFCKAFDQPADRAALKGLVDEAGFDAAPAALGGLVGAGCQGDPATFKTVLGEFKDEASRKDLKRVLADGGLAGKTDKSTGKVLIAPDCLGHLLNDGLPAAPSGGTAEDRAKARCAGLKTLLAGLDKPACVQLAGVLDAGGLGRAPAGLAKLVGIGCEGKPADLKTFLGAFDGDASRAALARAVDKGGLAGKTDPTGKTLVDPSCLAQVLKHGHAEPASGQPQPTLATRCDKLRSLLTDLDDDANIKLADVLEDGGLGTQPEAFGHLIGLGCNGGAAQLKTLVTEFEPADNRLALKKLLEAGGFGSKKADGTPSGVNTECLGRLLGTGCEGKPAELKKLVKDLNDGDRAALEGVMSAGELGKKPRVLAKLYKFGCLQNPAGADNGDKSPKVLKDMVGEFAGATGAVNFKQLLVDGQLGDQEDRLGSILRHAFTPKRPAGGVQDGKKLKQLHTAFNGNMPDLVTTITALEGADDRILEANAVGKESNQPGKALQNVVCAPGHGGNATQLHAKFYTGLKNRSTNATAGNPARLTLTALIQNAASFEHEPYTGGDKVSNGYNVAMGHIVNRHTRKFNSITPTTAPGGTGNPTTLYKRIETEVSVLGRINGAMGNIPNPHRGNRPAPPPGLRRNPPQDVHDLNGHPPGVQYATVADGSGQPSKMGFRMGGGQVVLGQFFPKPGGDLITVNYEDFSAMRTALI